MTPEAKELPKSSGHMDDRSIEAIWRACGAYGPLRIGVSPPEPARVEVVPYPFALIGRDSRCDLCLEDDSISRRHALMLVIEGRIFAADLASREGTLWGDGARQWGWVEGPRGIGIGGYRVAPQAVQRVVLEGANDPPPGNPLGAWPQSRKHGPEWVLEVLSPHTKKTRWRINRVVTLVGRAPECKMRLMDQSVSAAHCVIVCTGMGLWVIDLLGREGIQVNDKDVRFARLADNDDLRVGRFLFRARAEVPRASSSSSEIQERGRQVVGLPAIPSWQGGLPAELAPSGPSMFMPSRIGTAESDMDMPATTGQRPAAEAYLLPIVNALQMLQQHDQAQHHQTMMMLQTIFAMQGEQIRDVRHQLDHVLHVLKDMRTLPTDPSWVDRLALVARNGAQPAPAPAKGQNGLPFSTIAGALLNGPPLRKAEPLNLGTPSSPTQTSPAQSPTPAGPSGAVASASATDSPAADARAEAANPEGEPPKDEDKTFVQDNGINTLICSRLDEIRKERMSLWQKILDMVGGS